MNARFNNERFLFWMASSFFALNFVNLIAWSMDFYISPTVFGLAFLVFVLGACFNLEGNWTTLATLICLLLIILGAPLSDWDARYIWFFHAKRIFMDNSLYAQMDNYFPGSHNDYPVLVPAIAASIAKGVGFWNEFFPRLSLVFVLIPVFLLMRLLFEKNASFGLSILGVLYISQKLLVNGYMDAILGFYVAVACLLLVRLEAHPEDNKSCAFLIWICLSLPMIKNEGVLALCLLTGGVVFVFRKQKIKWLIPVATFIIYYVLWKRHVGTARIETTDLFVSGILERALKRLSSKTELLEIFASMAKISGIYLLALFIFIWKYRGSAKTWLIPACFVVAYTAAMFAIYLITTLDLTEHLTHSVDRVLLPVNLTIFFVLVSKVKIPSLEEKSKQVL